jgi:hypothetical protein
VGVGVHGSPWHQVTLTLSTRQPSLEPLLSLAMRHRSTHGSGNVGMFTTVVINPPELPLHA